MQGVLVCSTVGHAGGSEDARSSWSIVQVGHAPDQRHMRLHPGLGYSWHLAVHCSVACKRLLFAQDLIQRSGGSMPSAEYAQPKCPAPLCAFQLQVAVRGF